MTTYLAFLRGINVGGNALIKMADLKTWLADAGLQAVRTYIQSGNVLFESDTTDKLALAKTIERAIESHSKLDVKVVVFTKKEWQDIIAAAPKWWGKQPEWKHNLLIMLPPFDMPEVVKLYGQLKPDIEALQPGLGVLYQSISFQDFGRTTAGKLAANPIYKTMTIRNYNTAQKLLALLG
jgi:uncharacterized protein (DUF1697 family)